MLTDVCLDWLVPMGRGNSLCDWNTACALTKVHRDWLVYFFFFLAGLCSLSRRRGVRGCLFGSGSRDDGPQLSSAPSRHIGFIVVDPNYSCTDQLCLNV